MNTLHTWDTTLSRRLTIPPDHPRWHITARLAHLGDGTMIFGGLAVLGLAGRLFHRPILLTAAITIFISLAISATVVMAIKYTLRRERPGDPGGFVILHYDKYSFPSGHSARMSTLAVAVLPFNLPIGLILCLIAVVVATARVIIGIHYLGDVLTGLVLGALVSVSVYGIQMGLLA